MGQVKQSYWNKPKASVQPCWDMQGITLAKNKELKLWQIGDAGLPESLITRPAKWEASLNYTESHEVSEAESPSDLLPLSSLLDDLREHKPLTRSASLLNLAREVVRNQEARQNEDIDAWAERIANDVPNFIDES